MFVHSLTLGFSVRARCVEPLEQELKGPKGCLGPAAPGMGQTGVDKGIYAILELESKSQTKV